MDAPGLVPGAAPADVSVDWSGVADAEGDAGRPLRRIVEPTGGWLEVSALREGTRLRFGYAGDHVQFDVAPGATHVAVTWTPGVLPVHAGTLLMSTVLGYLLHCHGRLALHASVVAQERRAFAFAGAAGAGKSTTVGALMQRGCAVVSDDLAALRREPAGWVVLPGLTSIRLTPEAMVALAVPSNAVSPVWPHSPHLSDKAVLQVEEKPVTQEALPLAGIFLLPARSTAVESPCVSDVPPAAAVPGLTAQLSTPAWLERTIDETRFRKVVDLAASTPVRVVERPDRLDALPQLGEVLLAEMERLQR